jgi:hypothetical protein
MGCFDLALPAPAVYADGFSRRFIARAPRLVPAQLPIAFFFGEPLLYDVYPIKTLLARYRVVAQRLARDLQSLRCLLMGLGDGSQR